MFKRVLSIILTFTLFAAPLLNGAANVHAASTDHIKNQIEKQIRAFADSIDKSDADGTAAAALATHGITGRGKTLKVGKTHALTATLFNSELLQTALVDICAEAIQSMQTLDLASMPYIRGFCCWYGASDSFYYCATYEEGNWVDNKTDWYLTLFTKYNGARNDYDNSLDWMAANTQVFLNITRTKVTATEVTYSVACTVADRFDFRTSNGSGFKDILSGIAALAFKEYDWEASATFQLTVPYSCTHSYGTHQFVYDPESQMMVSPETGRNLTRHTTGNDAYYFELDETARLYHNVPWVLEFDGKSTGTLVLTPFEVETASASFPCIFSKQSKAIFAYKRFHFRSDEDAQPDRKDFYGTTLDEFLPDSEEICTYRMENVVHSDGSNMIYLSVWNTETGAVLADKIPMDTHYNGANNMLWYFANDDDNWVSGKDFYIHYIGNQDFPFSAEYFELRIWENGQDIQTQSAYNAKITKPTCTAQGYTTFTCALCGYSYKGDKTKATAHNYENFVCTGCGDRKYIPGDVDLDNDLDVDDVLALLWNVLFPEEYPIEVNADFDGNGTTDVDDVLTLLWHVLFPEDYPL